VDEVVQRVHPEQQELVVRGGGDVGEPGEGEPEQADEHVDGPEHLGETLDGHGLQDLLGRLVERCCRLARCSWGRLDRFIRPPGPVLEPASHSTRSPGHPMARGSVPDPR
jgi:hypothetical protein